MNKIRLVIDHGNTRLKATVFNGDEAVDRIVVCGSEPDAVLELSDRCHAESAIYASTAGVDTRLVETLDRTLPGGCLLLSASLPLPIGIDYATPATLGADRIASAAGAYAEFGSANMLIVDAGTCITLDLLRAGTFVGGNISPGISMRLQAMHDYSAVLPLVELPPLPSTPFGRCTADALRCGVMTGVAGEIQYSLTQAEALHGPVLPVLTGGDAPLIAQGLPLSCELRPELVMTGLLKILQYNESI